MIASHHDHLHAGPLRIEHSLVHSFFRWVLNAVEANELKVFHGEVAVIGIGPFELSARRDLAAGNVALGDAKDAASLAHEVLELLLDLRHGSSISAKRGVLQDALRSSLQDRKVALARTTVDREHPLVLGVERDLECFVVFWLGLQNRRLTSTACHLRAGTEDRHLRWRSGPALLSTVHLDLRAIVEDPAKRRCFQAFHCLEFSAVLLAVVNLQAEISSRNWHHEILDGHLTSGERACFVGAEDRDASKSLHSINLANNDVARSHLIRGNHEGDRHRWQKTLGNLCKQSCCTVLEDLGRPTLHRRKQIRQQAQQAHTDGHDRDDVDEVFNLNLEGRLDSGRLDALGNLSEESRISRCMDQTGRVALQDRGSEEGQIACFRRWTCNRLCLRVAWLRH
mmetsp:Transcript_59991/g.140165  ORF Transcript_59991/g.140165 Transcript_59991/m.140165 type:complete len:396 (-) Transcript_59991:894-2081(-)